MYKSVFSLGKEIHRKTSAAAMVRATHFSLNCSVSYKPALKFHYREQEQKHLVLSRDINMSDGPASLPNNPPNIARESVLFDNSTTIHQVTTQLRRVAARWQ